LSYSSSFPGRPSRQTTLHILSLRSIISDHPVALRLPLIGRSLYQAISFITPHDCCTHSATESFSSYPSPFLVDHHIRPSHSSSLLMIAARTPLQNHSSLHSSPSSIDHRVRSLIPPVVFISPHYPGFRATNLQPSCCISFAQVTAISVMAEFPGLSAWLLPSSFPIGLCAENPPIYPGRFPHLTFSSSRLPCRSCALTRTPR
jgi:hypothetical protein